MLTVYRNQVSKTIHELPLISDYLPFNKSPSHFVLFNSFYAWQASYTRINATTRRAGNMLGILKTASRQGIKKKSDHDEDVLDLVAFGYRLFRACPLGYSESIRRPVDLVAFQIPNPINYMRWRKMNG